VLEWNPPHAKWFVGARLNVCYNCVGTCRSSAGLAARPAILCGRASRCTGRPAHARVGASRRSRFRDITYDQLHDDVCRFANGLRALGIRRGDVVTIYMPMVPEAAIAMLACARIGAPHSVIFGGFSSQAIVDRVEDAKSTILITADGGRRRGQVVPLKANVDEALKRTSLIKKVVVLKHTGNACPMEPEARHLVERRGGAAEHGLPPRADGRRGPAVHPVHVGLDG